MATRGQPPDSVRADLQEGDGGESGDSPRIAPQVAPHPRRIPPPGMGKMPRFVADAMVGKLAKWLRAFGFDVFYHPFADDAELITVARERAAILLTRDRHLREVPGVRTIFIESDHVGEQLRQVVQEAPLDLSEARPLTRCTACNGELRPAARREVWERIPPFIYLTQEHYAVCPDCGRVYWEGTHVARLREKLEELARHTREAA